MKEKYLNMQKTSYDQEAEAWTVHNRNPVVGTYDAHNNWDDYNNFLFKNFDTNGLLALEYGCGPGRNIIKFSNRFRQIDGLDISSECIVKAKINLNEHNISNSRLMVNNGDNIPTEDAVYDVVFSVICLQHICSRQIRLDIFKEVLRVLKPGGKFCFQMGLGGKSNSVGYYDNDFDATVTNGSRDVSIEDEEYLRKDLLEIGFKDYLSDVRQTGPGDSHKSWLWVQVAK